MKSFMTTAPSKFLWIFGLILYLFGIAIGFMEPVGSASDLLLLSNLAMYLGSVLLLGYGLWWAIKKCLNFVVAHFSRAPNID